MTDTNDTNTNTTNLLQQALEAERLKSQQLDNANRALVQEFSKADTYEEQLEIAKKAIKDILPKAIETVNELIIDDATPAGVRAGLSKYILDSVLSGKLDRSTDAEVAGLLMALRENDSKAADRLLEG